MNPDAVYQLLVEANPVRDLEATPTPAPSPHLVHLRRDPSGSETMTLTTTEPVESPTRRTPPRRWPLAAAAAVLVAIGFGAFLATRDEGDPVDRSDESPPAAPNTIPTREELAITTVQHYHDALVAGDADAVLAVTNPDFVDPIPERNLVEQWVVLGREHELPELTNCSATEPSVGEWIDVRCDTTINDPVWVELGVDELVNPFRAYDDQTLQWLPYEGADFSAAIWAYSDYLRLFHTADYDAVCQPGAYETGTVYSVSNMALTGACAELWAPLGDAVVQWIRDGRPEPTE